MTGERLCFWGTGYRSGFAIRHCVIAHWSLCLIYWLCLCGKQARRRCQGVAAVLRRLN